MGFNNGYDSGYADALDDVRSGRVAGLGPASGGGEAAPAPAPAPTHMTNAADRYVTMTTGSSGIVRYAAPESVTVAANGTTFDLQVPTSVPVGTVMNVNLAFGYGEGEPGNDDFSWTDNSGANIGVDTITVNGAALSGMPAYDMSSITGLQALVLWYDGASWVCVASASSAY